MKKNICPYCGGKLAISYQGLYSSIYRIRKDGTPYKRRLRRIMGDESDAGSEFIFCLDCGKEIEAEEEE